MEEKRIIDMEKEKGPLLLLNGQEIIDIDPSTLNWDEVGLIYLEGMN